VLNIPGLERNLIYVTKMSDGGMHTLFQKDSCKMVRGAMVLMIRSLDRYLVQVIREC
jgi:hypothetical protein